jgi:hypothetical protein
VKIQKWPNLSIIPTLIISFSALLLSGCPSETKGNKVIPEDPSLKACEFKPNEGGAAVSSASTADRIESSGFFNKNYDVLDLEAVLRASTQSTADFVKSLGVAVYKIPGPQKSQCKQFSFLETAPQNLEEQWQENGGLVGNEKPRQGGGFLAGLYIDFNAGSRRIGNPTILIYEPVDRWTIVHEMMHHNFNKTRKADPNFKSTPYLNVELRNNQAALLSLYNGFQSIPDVNDLRKIISLLELQLELSHQSMVQGPYEEVAIEAMLLERAINGRFRFVAIDANSSSWYMKSSQEKGEALVRTYDTLMTPSGRVVKDNLRAWAQSEAEARVWPEVVELTKKLGAKAEVTAQLGKTIIKEWADRLEPANLSILKSELPFTPNDDLKFLLPIGAEFERDINHSVEHLNAQIPEFFRNRL